MYIKRIKHPIALLFIIFLLIPNFSVRAAMNDSFMVENGSNITSIAVNNDATQFIVGTSGAMAYIYNGSGEMIRVLEAKNVVTGVSLLQDGSAIISSDDRTLSLYDPQGKLVWQQKFNLPVKTVVSSKDGAIIAVYLNGSNEIILLNNDGEIKNNIDSGFSIRSLAVSNNGEWIATGGADQYIRIFDPHGKKVSEISTAGIINAIAISDLGTVAMGSDNTHIYLLDQEGNTLVDTQADWRITDVDITADGQYFSASDMRGFYYLISQEGEKLWSKQGKGIARAVSFGGEGKMLFTGSEEGLIQLFDVGNVIEEAKKAETVKNITLTGIVLIILLVVLSIIFVAIKQGNAKIFKDIWKAKYNYLVLLPSIIFIGLFLYYPAITGLIYSFFEWNPGGKSHFIGLDNFKKILHDQYVITGMKNLVIIMISGTIKLMIPPLIVAELLYFLRNKTTTYWFRTLFVASMILPSVANILIWQNIYGAKSGLLNEALRLFGLGSFTQAWLANPNTALWAIIFIGFPFISILHLLVYYSGLISISDELKDAAMIDGAGPFRIIRSIHLPLIAGQFKLLMVLTIIGLIQDFNSMLIITGGGPGISTYVPALQMYYSATKFNDMGYASSIGVVMFLMIFILTLINLRMVKSED
ncbi:DUF5711 family protein [Lederbergia citri]|uniref:ABC transporter permease subunit n=1 Tax=Lederbergia citri TaxID=2833580 RepID=A0A942TG18_9BACI|nr:DUF5711 family protein [Lederbergia citri]MBS4197003.1 ABC transporter permease subunit [Lederbergia citri]